jgi:TolA-binding protein
MLALRMTLQVTAVAIALVTALLDYGRNDRRTRAFRHRRMLLVGLMVVLLIGTSVAEVASDRAVKANVARTEKQRESDVAEIRRLRGEVHGEEVAHRREAQQAIGSIDHLQQRLAELQSKITNAELQKEIQQYAGELREARAALRPGPKARLSAYFQDPSNLDAELSEAYVYPSDGVVKFTMFAKNASSADANVGEIWFRVPTTDCEVVEPPGGLQLLPSAHAGEYTTTFNHLGVDERVGPYTFSLKLGSAIRTFGIGFRFSCQTCESPVPWTLVKANVGQELKIFGGKKSGG